MSQEKPIYFRFFFFDFTPIEHQNAVKISYFPHKSWWKFCNFFTHFLFTCSQVWFIMPFYFLVVLFNTSNTFLSQVWLDGTTIKQRWGWEWPWMMLFVVCLINTNKSLCMHHYYEVWLFVDHHKVFKLYISNVLIFGTTCMEYTEGCWYDAIEITIEIFYVVTLRIP